MGKGDYDGGIPQEAQDFKATPDVSPREQGGRSIQETTLSDAELGAAFKKSRAFEMFYQMPRNVDSIRKYAQTAELEGVSPDLLNRALLAFIEVVRGNIARTEKGLKDKTIGGGDSFEHGVSATTGYQKSKLESDQKRLAELEALAAERGIL